MLARVGCADGGEEVRGRALPVLFFELEDSCVGLDGGFGYDDRRAVKIVVTTRHGCRTGNKSHGHQKFI